MLPFNRMYQLFRLFSDAAARRKEAPFLHMSAGVNWLPACPSVLRCLHAELDSALTYRNYGRSAGAFGVTDALEQVEFALNAGQYRPAVTITNGTTEGARLVFELLAASRSIQPGDTALMVGQGFPLYSLLSEAFGLEFKEVLSEFENPAKEYLPAMDRVLHSIETCRPKIVFLIIPNNPIGECYPEQDMSALAQTCSSCGAVLLVDRVCLMPWDDYGASSRAFAPQIASGPCFFVDSFSKSESLAGLRTGFIVSNEAHRDTLVELTKARWLNPVVFSTMTLAYSRLAMLANDSSEEVTSGLSNGLIDHLIHDCAAGDGGQKVKDHFAEFCTEYRNDMAARRKSISNNYKQLCDRLGSTAIRPMKLDAGFNVALCLPTMLPVDEEADQRCLAEAHGVGVLTEMCFRSSTRTVGNYFARLGMTLPPDDFRQGLDAICEYYLSR
ncbi:MAG TPA: pyridoxal phosphate-dependent aminotransferase [Terracidiphilus sp.]|nr:pyridoxal phosphate-dependent aminotransferase [Terracidiphilus sp.]